MKNWRMWIALLLFGALAGSCCLAFVGVDRTGIGLSQNILGSIIVAIFGIPQPDFSAQIVHVFSIPDEEERLRQSQRNKKFWHLACSYLGIALMMAGFALQLWHYVMPRGTT